MISIGKSRLNRSGESLLQTQNDDLTVSLVEAKRSEEMQTRAGSVAERIMNRLQTKDAWFTRHQLNSDPLVGGSIAAIKKTLQRLENRGVIEKGFVQENNRMVASYHALREVPRGEIIGGGQVPSNPVHDSKTCGDTPKKNSVCPPNEASAGAPSTDTETLSPSPRERTWEEIHSHVDQNQW